MLLRTLLFLIFTFLFFAPNFAQNTPIQNELNDYKKYLDLSYTEIDSLSNLYYSERAFEKAILLMKAGVEKATNDFGSEDSSLATYISDIGFFYNEMGDYEKALPFLIQAKNIYEKTFGKEHIYVANALSNLAYLYNDMRNYPKSIQLFDQAKDVYGKVQGTDHPDFAYALSNLAYLYNSLGNYEKALPLFIQTKDIYQKTLGEEHPLFANTLNSLAGLLSSMGDYEKALLFSIQAKNIREKILGKEHADLASSLNNVASLHNKMGNYEKALPLFIQAKNIQEKTYGREHPLFANALNNLAVLYSSMGDYNKELLFLVQAKNIYEKTLGNDHPMLATTLNNLATLYQSQGNYEKALPLFIKTKNIREKALGKAHPLFALSLTNLAGLYNKTGNYKKALLLFMQAKEIREQVLGQEHHEFANSLNHLGKLQGTIGNYEEALFLFIQAIQVMSLNNISSNINLSWADTLLHSKYPSKLHLEETISSLGGIYDLFSSNKTDEAIKRQQRVVAHLITQLLHKLRTQVSNEQDKLKVLKLSSLWLELNLNVLNTAEHSPNAFQLADENKSVLLLQATKSEQTYKLGNLPDSLIIKDKKMHIKQSQLQAKLMENRSEEEKNSLRNELIQINQNMDDFVQFLKNKYPRYYKLKYQQINTKVKDIQALLDDNTTLLEYVIGDSVVHIFYVDQTVVEWKKVVLSNKSLNYHIKSFHSALSNYKVILENEERAYRDYTIHAHWFYKNLLAPVLKDKKNIQNLIIVTDGEIGHLPFETFLVEQAPQTVTNYHQLHYLVNDYNISYNYSATLWKENVEAPTPVNNGQILALAANYKLKLDSSSTTVRLPNEQLIRETLLPLPAAREEVKTLQEKYRGFFAFDALASEKIVKEKASDFAILHFATHGILNSKKPILSSLAFSEDSDSIESNFWQAYEISKMQLNANLVVLSACETGFGEFEKGNGIASLARAFMYAGASSLIVSLWQVNDYATSEIMNNLYENLANGMRKDKALRLAKIKYMKSTEGIMAHPVFWSPFIQIGNTNSVYVSKKGGFGMWGIGIGLVLLFGIGGFIFSRRRKETY